MPADRSPSPAVSAPPPSNGFGVIVAGVGLLLPRVALEHVPAATVFPLPGAGAHVLGLVQLRGHPVVVLEAVPAEAEHRSPGHRPSLLVIGSPPEAGALVVAAAPRAIRVGEAAVQAQPPGVPFAAALEGAQADLDDLDMLWWRFDPRRLFELLAGG